VAFDATDKVILCAGKAGLTRAHAEHTDVVASDLARQLRAREDRNFLFIQQTDAAAEERHDIREAAAEWIGEAERARGLQKERALFGKEERETRQVDLPVVHFGFGEVSVEGRRPFEVRRDVVKDFSAEFARQRVVAGRAVTRPFRSEIRANI